MALTNQGNGTQTATVTTEHTLATITTGKTCVLLVNCINMVAGDVLELRAKVKVLTASTERVAYKDVFSGLQDVDDVVKISIPVPSLYSVKFTLKQTAGTSRNYEWSVVSLD